MARLAAEGLLELGEAGPGVVGARALGGHAVEVDPAAALRLGVEHDLDLHADVGPGAGVGLVGSVVDQVAAVVVQEDEVRRHDDLLVGGVALRVALVRDGEVEPAVPPGEQRGGLLLEVVGVAQRHPVAVLDLMHEVGEQRDVLRVGGGADLHVVVRQLAVALAVGLVHPLEQGVAPAGEVEPPGVLGQHVRRAAIPQALQELRCAALRLGVGAHGLDAHEDRALPAREVLERRQRGLEGVEALEARAVRGVQALGAGRSEDLDLLDGEVAPAVPLAHDDLVALAALERCPGLGLHEVLHDAPLSRLRPHGARMCAFRAWAWYHMARAARTPRVR